MTRREFNALLLACCLSGLASAQEAFEPKVERLVGAYNSGDWRGFYSEYAQAMGALATEQNFQKLYTNGYKKEFGNIQSRKLNQAQTSVSDLVALTVYDVVCDKKTGQLFVNWMKEGGQWKVQQVQLR